jgi:glycosyltransferase involved in cell wall biosynthesis
MPIVVIIYKNLPQWRRDFFNGLREALAVQGIELRLLYGQPGRRDALKNDTIELDWATKVPSKIWEFGRFELYWQPVLPFLKDADLVIVEQASKLLVNYVLLLQNALSVRKLAFWGHGKNMQATSANRLAEWVKRLVSTRVHWWFAYNEMSTRIVREMGFPAERITSVQNAIDTQSLTRARQALSEAEIAKVRAELGLRGNNIGIYAGGLYPEKRIPFLLEALHLVRAQIPDFEMIFIGSGVDAHLVEQAASQHPWIHYVGPKFDNEKVPYYAVSKLFLMPGLIGLGILDSFTMGTPLVTTDIRLHSPEIEYLENGINGICVTDAFNASAYANAIINLLCNKEQLEILVQGCKVSMHKYTVENMIENFKGGILQSLNSEIGQARQGSYE